MRKVPSSVQVVVPIVVQMLLWVLGLHRRREGPGHCKVEGQVQR
jgi:hypothetical protein